MSESIPNASEYHVSVTAGPSYKEKNSIAINCSNPMIIKSDLADISLLVRVKNFRDAPKASSAAPKTCSYFEDHSRLSAQFSISWRMKPKKDLKGDKLMWQNDFDQPIRHLLPPFTNAALSVVKQWVDPGMESDCYGDEPYLRGPLVSSATVFRVGGQGDFDDTIISEDAVGEQGKKQREENEVPSTEPTRRKFFLQKEKKEEWIFKKDQLYEFDFFNGLLDFNNFSMKLPMGYSFSVLNIVKHENIPPLRFVLKDTESDKVVFHVTFELTESHSEQKPNTSEDDLD